MSIEAIQTEILADGAMSIESDDGIINHVLYRGQNWVNLETIADGSATLQASLHGEIETADETATIHLIWNRWRAAAA
jgi:hypothetical protein